MFGWDFSKVQRCSEHIWRQPQAKSRVGNYKWQAGDRVFVCSISDFFHKDADQWRPAAWAVIKSRPDLIWIITTKRIERAYKHIPQDFVQENYPNIVFMPTCGTQKMVDERIPVALKLKGVYPWVKIAVSVEPMLGEINLKKFLTNTTVGGEWNYEDTNKSQAGRRKVDNRSCQRILRDRLSGSNMEISGKTGLPVGEKQNHSAESEKTQSGETTAERLHGNSDPPKAQDSMRLCSSSGMEALQREDTSGINNKSQERNKKRQQAAKSGANDIQRTSQAQDICTGENTDVSQSKRRKESRCEVDEKASKRDSETQTAGRGTKINSQRLQNIIPNSLGHCSKKEMETSGINLCIIGAESKGSHPGRECKIEWVRDLVKQCKAAGVKVHVKQIHMWKAGGRLWENRDEPFCHSEMGEPKLVLVKKIEDFPKDLQIREEI